MGNRNDIMKTTAIILGVVLVGLACFLGLRDSGVKKTQLEDVIIEEYNTWAANKFEPFPLTITEKLLAEYKHDANQIFIDAIIGAEKIFFQASEDCADCNALVVERKVGKGTFIFMEDRTVRFIFLLDAKEIELESASIQRFMI